MGLPVRVMARDVGGGVLQFPLDAGLPKPKGSFVEDDLVADVDDSPIDSRERDRRFAEMAERQARFLFRIAHGLLRNVQDAEDAVQEALLKLYRTDGWLRMEDERAFLARTVWRTGLDLVARRPRLTETLDDGAGREFAAAGRSAEQAVVADDERVMLGRLIEALPETLRQPLVLSAIEEMTSREVALALAIPEGTVRTRVMRARAELRRRFEAMRVREAGRT